MLVLSRKAGDTLVIDNQITITVTKISGNRVTLGIKAPNDVRILRGELQEFEIAPAPTIDVAPQECVPAVSNLV